MLTQEFTRSWAQPATSWYCMSSKMAAYSLAADCIISHFSVADLPQTVPVAYWYAASLEQSFILPQICRRPFLWHTSMRQVWSKVSSCRRLFQWHTSMRQVWIKVSSCRRLFLWHTGMRQVCSKISFCRIFRHTLCRRLKVCRRSAAGLRHTFHFPMGCLPCVIRDFLNNKKEKKVN